MKLALFLLFLFSFNYISAQEKSMSDEKIVKSEEEWKEILSPEEFRILRKKGTGK